MRFDTLDYFLCGHVKSLAYAAKRLVVQNYSWYIRDIGPAMLEQVAHNWMSKMRFVKNSHIPEIVLMPCIHLLNKQNYLIRIQFVCVIVYSSKFYRALKKHPLHTKYRLDIYACLLL